MRPALFTFLTLALLWVLVAQLNHELAGLHVYLFTGGLTIAYAALVLPQRDGLAAVVLAGLLADANSPVPFGTHTLLFAIAHTITFNARDRVPRDETVARVIVALLANLGLFLVFSFTQIARLPSPAAAWPRLIFDLLCSQVLLAVVAPWFFALQARVLILARAGRDSLA
jgi:rod shape-determining protein MreD